MFQSSFILKIHFKNRRGKKKVMEIGNSSHCNDLLCSLISDIKSYTGKDPILPWLRGIKKMKECLPPQTLNEKLPRFLQKCAQSFESDRRYRNDIRYIRVWLQLMDFVDDPKALLRTMEENQIGLKQSLFYQAYALYYEKIKRFEEAEKMYYLGVQNLAEPVDELQKAYELFLHRMERQKTKKIQRQEGRTAKRPLSARSIPLQCIENKENNDSSCRHEDRPTGVQSQQSDPETVTHNEIVKTKKLIEKSSQNVKPLGESNHIRTTGNSCGNVDKMQIISDKETKMLGIDDTLVVKFVDNAIVGKSEAEDACHHGLVDPTINMKEAMNAINSMFREPIETAPVKRRSQRCQREEDHGVDNGFSVFIDENVNYGTELSKQKEKGQHSRAQIYEPSQQPFEIYIDDEENNEIGGRNNGQDEVQIFPESSNLSASHQNAFVFLHLKDQPSESSDDLDAEGSPRVKFREDTVVHRFVGSTISDEPQVENVCHHGLVDPTINLKEAMDDINNMFGKPIDFVRAKRSKKQDKAPVSNDFSGFSILPDDDLEQHQRGRAPSKPSNKLMECDLFEPTVMTKEAMDEINKMFGMPMDF